MKYGIFILIFTVFSSCIFDGRRGPSSNEKCQADGKNCDFLIIGHRGAPYEEAENTIKAFQESMNRGGNAVEIDVNMTKDDHIVIVLHDRHPNQLIALVRQAGLEGLKYIPYVPNIGDAKRVFTEELTLEEIRADYGYALNEGLLANIFTSNKRDTLAVIPTLQEFSEWSEKQDNLHAIFVDIKVGEKQNENALKILAKVKKYFRGQQKKVYLMSPYLSIFKTIKDELQRNPEKGMEALLDTEENKVLATVKKKSLSGVSTGFTLFKNWETYLKNIDRLVSYREDPNSPPLYPIIAWTVDDDFKLYKLVQHQVDGIMTNRPRRLARLIKRHFKDHSMTAKTVAKCYDNVKRTGKWQHCASGVQVNPFQGIGHDDVTRWVCHEEGMSQRLLEVFGCIGSGVVRFEDELENSKLSNIWISPKNKIVVAKSHHDFGDEQYPVILEFNQKSCNDGFLNYDCEYFFELEYRNKQGRYKKIEVKKKSHDSSFVVFANIPKDAERLRVVITELDGGDRRDKIATNIPTESNAEYKLTSRKKVFKGILKFIKMNYDDFKVSHVQQESFSIDFKQTYCNDGFLNYDCEYNIKVFYYDQNWSLRRAENFYKDFDSSFTYFSSIPKESHWIKVYIEELDDGVPHPSGKATGLVTMHVKHGAVADIRSVDNTFKGKLTLKKFDYNEKTQHSEGVKGFKPHKINQK